MITTLIGAAIIGIALGVLGSGGSILTIPVLVFGLGVTEKTAIASSLIIVGAIAGFGALLAARRGLVVRRCLILFGLPGIAGAAAGGWFAPLAPDWLQMSVFGVLVIAAAWITARAPMSLAATPGCGPWPRAMAAGSAIGALTGFVGVGGGFLLVPALLRFGGLGLDRAVGTSLALIAINCVIGLGAQMIGPAPALMAPGTLAIFVVAGILGLVAGRHYARNLPANVARIAFIVLLAIIAVYTVWHTLTIAG
jgi:uncharacterized protein